jgi:hypothetical protein
MAILTLGICVTGCSDPIDGHWDLLRIDQEPFPFEFTDEEGCEATDGLGLEIEVGAEPSVEAFEIHDSEACDLFEVMAHEGAVRVEERGERYELDLHRWGEAGVLRLACTLEEDRLSCQGRDGGSEFEFER